MPRIPSLTELLATGSATALLSAVVVVGLPATAGAQAAAASTPSCWQSFLPLPDPGCTPGMKSPDVT